MGALFLSDYLFQARLLLFSSPDEVEGPASAAKKRSAFFVGAPVYRQANDPTVVTRGS